MANIGTVRSFMPNLWSEPAFQELFQETGWEKVKEELDKGNSKSVFVSSTQQKKVLQKYLTAEQIIDAGYKEEFILHPEKFWPARCVLHPDSPDAVTTMFKYVCDNSIAYLLSYLFPNRTIENEWFIDGQADYGEYKLLNGQASDISEGNVFDDMISEEEKAALEQKEK